MAPKKTFSKGLKNIFFRGLIAILPSALTIVLVYWIFVVLERTFKIPIKEVLGDYYFPGLGILVALVVIFFIGIIINNWIIQKLYSLGEKILRKTPLIKTIYNSIYDVMQYFKTGDEEKFGAIVKANIQGWELLGFVTRETFDDLFKEDEAKDRIAVYIPFSYQIGGFTFLIPRSDITKLDIPKEQAMRFIITAGMIKNHEIKK